MTGTVLASPIDRASPLASILVVNFNAGAYLAACLAALQAQTVRQFEAIILDNASSDGSFDAAKASVAEDPRFRFVAAGLNLGFAGGNNRAAALANAPLLVTLNPDAFAEPDWLECLIAAAHRNPEVAMFGSLQIDARDPSRLDGAGDNYLFAGLPWRGGFGWPAHEAPPTGGAFGPCAAAAMYRTDAFRRAGGFDEDFFCYVEDVDLAFRLRLLGETCLQLSEAKVRHVGGASSKGSSFARFYGTRNLVLCFVKNMPAPLFWPLLPAHLALLLALWCRAAMRGEATVVAKALLESGWRLPAMLRKRRDTLSRQKVSSMSIARALCWSPFSPVRRQPVRQKNPG